MNANWIRLVPLAVAFGMGASGEASAGEGLAYRENLTTLNGKTYRQVRLVKVDPNGLLFRHRDGIAKVTFDNLDQGFRDYYDYDEKLARDFEETHSVKTRNSARTESVQLAESGRDDREIVVTFRTRTLIPLSYANPWSPVQAACGGVPWFSHWGRYHPALAYAHFPCRQLAERDLLIRSGIVPTPRGVSVRRRYR